MKRRTAEKRLHVIIVSRMFTSVFGPELISKPRDGTLYRLKYQTQTYMCIYMSKCLISKVGPHSRYHIEGIHWYGENIRFVHVDVQHRGLTDNMLTELPWIWQRASYIFISATDFDVFANRSTNRLVATTESRSLHPPVKPNTDRLTRKEFNNESWWRYKPINITRSENCCVFSHSNKKEILKTSIYILQKNVPLNMK